MPLWKWRPQASWRVGAELGSEVLGALEAALICLSTVTSLRWVQCRPTAAGTCSPNPHISRRGPTENRGMRLCQRELMMGVATQSGGGCLRLSRRRGPEPSPVLQELASERQPQLKGF